MISLNPDPNPKPASPFSQKERDLLGRIKDAEECLLSDQKQADSWAAQVDEVQKKLDSYIEYRDSYRSKAKDRSTSLQRMREDLKTMLSEDKLTTVPEIESVREDCIDQLESRSKVEAPNARDKTKRSAGKRSSDKGHSR